MSGSQRLLQAFFNWGLNLLTSPQSFDHISSDNKYLSMLRQLVLSIDSLYFQTIPKFNFSIKEIEQKLCRYSIQVLGINKQPLLSQDYLGKITPLKMIIVFKLVFRIINQKGQELKIHKLQDEDRKLLEHFIKSLNLNTKQQQSKDLLNQSEKTIKKSFQKSKYKEENQLLKKQLLRCYQREKQIKQQNDSLKQQIRNYEQQKRVSEILFEEFKQRFEILEDAVMQISQQFEDAQEGEFRTCEYIPPPQINQSIKTPSQYYTPTNNFFEEERNRTQSNVSNSTTADVAKLRYKKLKQIHKEFQLTMKQMMER